MHHPYLVCMFWHAIPISFYIFNVFLFTLRKCDPTNCVDPSAVHKISWDFSIDYQYILMVIITGNNSSIN